MNNDPQFPITFVDYNIIVPSEGVIIFDAELNPNNMHVKNGDMFEAVVKDNRLTFMRVSK
jgi:hypothetical protein